MGRGGEGRSVQSMGEMGKDFCPNFFQPFLAPVIAQTVKIYYYASQM